MNHIRNDPGMVQLEPPQRFLRSVLGCLIGSVGSFLLVDTGALPAEACSVCFYGDPDGQANRALRWGIVSLLVVLLGVIAGFVKFFWTVGKRQSLALPKPDSFL